jgi:dTDP-glucose 4,6-dehydratase
MAKKILIIGSNSFSGSNFINFISSIDLYEQIIGISRSELPAKTFLPFDKSLIPHFDFHQLDLNQNFDEIIKVITKYKPAIIVNYAAQSMVAQSWDNPVDWYQTNVISLIKLQQFLNNVDFLDRFIQITTPEVYGNCEGFVNEDNAFNPSTPYAISRACGDMSFKAYFNSFGFPIIFTRAANVYGPFQQLYRIIPKTIFSILNGEKLNLHGGGISTRSFIHINDVSSATHQLITDGVIGETYHISTNDIISIKDLVIKICNLMNVDFDDHVIVDKERIGKDMAYHLSSKKIRDNLGWKDQISLNNGIVECIDWVKSYNKELLNSPKEYVHKK